MYTDSNRTTANKPIETAPEDATHTNCLFQESWWLNAVAPGEWTAAEIKSNGEVVARLPYILKQKYGIQVISKPKLTQTLGPWIRPSQAKYGKRLGQEKDLLEELIKQLPPAHSTRIFCHNSFSNLLPFYWAGFEIGVSYTYRLPDLTDPDILWSGFLDRVKTDVRKAQRQLCVRDDLGLDRFLDINEMTFRRQGLQLPYTRGFVQRLDETLTQRKCRRMLFAEDKTGAIHAAVYIVWDNRATYYLMGGADPDRRNSGASSLLLWHAIQHAGAVSREFDFEGSMIEPVERFVRGFGAIQTPYYHATKESLWMKLAGIVRKRVRRGPLFGRKPHFTAE